MATDGELWFSFEDLRVSKDPLQLGHPGFDHGLFELHFIELAVIFAKLAMLEALADAVRNLGPFHHREVFELGLESFISLGSKP